MDTKVKLILDAIGILIGLVGFALLIADEKYIVSGLILFFLILLVIYAIRLVRSKPYQVKRIIYEYIFCDEGPALTKISKTTVFIPKEKNITKFEDLGIGADGQISSISTNNGTLKTRKDGGAISVTTIFDTALIIGNEYIHILLYHGESCFPGKCENVVHSTIHKMDEAIIDIKFCENKRPSNFKAIHKLGSKFTEVTGQNVEINNLNYVLTFKNPPRGSVFELKWEW